MKRLKQIHAHTLRHGTDQDALIHKILQIPNIHYARKVFDQIPRPHVFLYNKLIQAYSSHNQPHQSLHLFSQLCRFHKPNEHTYTFVFAACASLPSPFPAQAVHSHFAKSGFASDFIASTALVDAYAKLRLIRNARKLFDQMPVRDVPTWNSMIAGYGRSGDMAAALEMFDSMPTKSVVSWTAMISGYSQNRLYADALEFFLRMEEEGEKVKPNEVTIASVLPACANLGALEVGERIDAYARENGLMKNLYVGNALLEMYSRCGKIDVARRIFEEMGKRRNLCSWNTMIMGLAVHGGSGEALGLYEEMLKDGTSPDDVTFVGLLLACTHGGMVARGRQIFQSMETNFGISPKLEHYGCMVDLLGRAGELREAYNLIINTMRMKPDSVIWGTLLGACSFHNNVELAEVSAEALLELEPWNPGNYVILSNVYASAGRWDGVARLRKMMKGGQIVKAAGYSCVEVAGRVHKFMVADVLHPRSGEVYRLLQVIHSKMRKHKGCSDFLYQLEEFCSME